SSDRFFGRSVHSIQQPALVIFAGQPLNQAVVVSGEGGQFPGKKRVYVIPPSWRRNGGHRLVLFSCSRRHGLCLNSSYVRPQFPFVGSALKKAFTRASPALHCFQ